MKTKLTVAAGLFASSYAAAALTGSTAWDTSATAYDPAVSQLYSHLVQNGNFYLTPDANENRSAGMQTLGSFSVGGYDSLELFNLGGTAGDRNHLGVRVSFNGTDYELSFNPDSSLDTVPSHYFGSVNDILASVGGPAMGLTDVATLDFFIIDIEFNPDLMVYSSEQHPWGSLDPMFDFTPELLVAGGFNATPLPGSKASAIAFLNSGFEVWGFEDRNQIDDVAPGFEPDYNDRLFAFRIVPVPEPSTYGVIGAIALLGLIAQRRFKMKKA